MSAFRTGLHNLGLSAIYTNEVLDATLAAPPGNSTLGQNGEKLRQWVASWAEQRLYPYYALDALNISTGTDGTDDTDDAEDTGEEHGGSSSSSSALAQVLNTLLSSLLRL